MSVCTIQGDHQAGSTGEASTVAATELPKEQEKRDIEKKESKKRLFFSGNSEKKAWSLEKVTKMWLVPIFSFFNSEVRFYKLARRIKKKQVKTVPCESSEEASIPIQGEKERRKRRRRRSSNNNTHTLHTHTDIRTNRRTLLPVSYTHLTLPTKA